MSEAIVSCKANISPAGRLRRVRVGTVGLVLFVVLLVILVAARAAWYWRLVLFLPGAVAAVGLLQARRNTCIKRADEGTFEHDDFSTTKAPDDEVAASRVVAAGIRRETLLAGLVAAAIGVASAALR
jgi:hypothetical protein